MYCIYIVFICIYLFCVLLLLQTLPTHTKHMTIMTLVQTICPNTVKHVMTFKCHPAPLLQGQGARSSEYSFNSSSTRSWASKTGPGLGRLSSDTSEDKAFFGENIEPVFQDLLIWSSFFTDTVKYTSGGYCQAGGQIIFSH